MDLIKLESEIEKLHLKDRATLAHWLLSSLDDLPASDLEALWAQEAERRLDEMEQGTSREISAEDTFLQAKAALK